jgi:hypothetical protein
MWSNESDSRFEIENFEFGFHAVFMGDLVGPCAIMPPQLFEAGRRRRIF